MARSRVVGVVSTGQSGTRAWRCRGRVKCLLSSGSGPEFVFVHTQTHPDNRGAHPKSHPRPRAHSLARKQTFACTENQLSDEKCTQANPPYMRACTFLGQAKGRGVMDTQMEACGRQAACRDTLSSCPSFASPPGSELTPPVPKMSQKHQQHRHLHAAQCDVGQHAPSPATLPPGRRVPASRNHPAEKTPCSSTPIQSAWLL